ncbi:lanthionine synthetase C family protein [Streptomyces cyaneofuscatus]|uniref:lanthionine synthetase C family protein n=1 Tax=Streptomyces cyaneofuscatus TaxID=66883 RepID=UPI0036626F48
MNAPAAELSAALAGLLTDLRSPALGPRTAAEDRQHLAYGLPGIALLHIERAAAGLAPWSIAHDWLTAAVGQPFTVGPDSHPFYGGPALAHAVACAGDHMPGAYAGALAVLDRRIVKDTHRRLTNAYDRLDAGRLPVMAEYDTIRGLAGYGAYLLRRDPGSTDVRAVLGYCVRLTDSLDHDGHPVPGWWTTTPPTARPDHRFPGGHANTGLSHGISGVLALLALAARHKTVVGGHHDAIRTILAWLDRWQENTANGPAWPHWVTWDELRTGLPARSAPRRPSWCYGTAGVARAQQLAALALGDPGRQLDAEKALIGALTDSAQLKATTDNGLCHGFTGLAHVAGRAAQDAHPSTAGQLRALIPTLLAAVCPPGADPADLAQRTVKEAGSGFLDGAAGIALALLAPATGAPPRTSWDACLLTA